MIKKRLLSVLISFIAGILAVCVLISVTRGRYIGLLPGVEYGDGLHSGSIQADADNARLISAAYEILGYIKDGEYGKVGEISHPETGVLFSPYATISVQSARSFTASEVAALGRDKQVYVWGVYDGSGEPIEMTPADYFARFVFDRDYTRTKLVGVDHIVRSGNALENISEIFPGMRFVDFHIPSPDGADIGWSSLRLGFMEYGDSLMLALILHSEYTI